MEYDPYQPPSLEHDPAALQPTEELPLASLSQRFLANLLDALIIYGPVFLLSFRGPTAFANKLSQDQDPLGDLFFSLITFLFFLALNGYLIQSRDQTIGKLALGIKVTTLKGESPHFLKQAGLRYGFFWFVGHISLIGSWISLIGILLIFGKNRRCLHDLLAGTRVVQWRPTALDSR